MRERPKYYALDENGEPAPIPGDDVIAWAKSFEEKSRSLKKTQIGDDCEVSTVFLALDHNLDQNGPPILWETLVFGGPLDGRMNRYTTRAAALLGHEEMVTACRNACFPSLHGN